jgi:hypothetical protein
MMFFKCPADFTAINYFLKIPAFHPRLQSGAFTAGYWQNDPCHYGAAGFFIDREAPLSYILLVSLRVFLINQKR